MRVGLISYGNGKVDTAYLAADAKVNGYLGKEDSLVSFYRDGNVSCCEIAQIVMINNVPMKAGSKLLFDTNGEIYAAMVPDNNPMTIYGVQYGWGTKIYFSGYG